VTAEEHGSRILVVEDDADLASVLGRALRERGHEVDIVGRGTDAVDVAKLGRHDVIVLDVMLPGMDGFAACRRMRELGVDATIILLTSRDAIEDRVTGLEAGADDYLAKPFALRELYARIQAVGRRRQATPSGQLVVGDLVLLADELAVERAGVRIELRVKEHAVLRLLMERAGRVVPRAEILDHAWEDEDDHRSNVIDVQVKRIREKLDRPFETELIETVRGVGYRLRKPDA
jgi:two-component system OmpR family response regulator